MTGEFRGRPLSFSPSLRRAHHHGVPRRRALALARAPPAPTTAREGARKHAREVAPRSLACPAPHAARPGHNFEVWCQEHWNDGDEEDLGKRLRGEYVDPDRKATAVTYRSDFKALWECRECGFEWRATMNNRTGKNHNSCPSCSGQLPLSPTYNFAAWCKENSARGARLLKEYDDPVIKPTEVTFASNKKVRWKCSKCKHTWEAVVQPHEERQTQRLPSVCGLRAPRPPEPDQQLRRVLRRQQRARRAATG